MLGTPNYIAPEILKDYPFDFKIDNFAIGVILFYMLTRELPFLGATVTETLDRIIGGTFSFPAGSSLSDLARDFVGKLLANKPR